MSRKKETGIFVKCFLEKLLKRKQMLNVRMMISVRQLEIHERVCGGRASQHDLAITVDSSLGQNHY
jgi:hypothetical protein